MTRVLVLGCRGMLGQRVFSHLASGHGVHVEGTDRTGSDGAIALDVARSSSTELRTLLLDGGYDLAVNCIGVRASSMTDDVVGRARAITVNALFPQLLAEAAQKTGTRVVHVSTDGVFSGTATEPYTEAARPDPADLYGMTKTLGEIHTDGVLTIRCSLIGRDPIGGRGLLEWVLRLPAGSRIEGYTDHLWNGVTTLQFARLCKDLLPEAPFRQARSEGPVHHFCPHDPVSKYELIRLIAAAYARELNVVPVPGPDGSRYRILATHYTTLQELRSEGPSIAEAVRTIANEE